MGSFGAKILNNAVSALSAQQALIANTANNIANVNTEGYARRVLSVQTRMDSGQSAGLKVGNGVEIGKLTRVADEFLNRLSRESAGSFYEHRTQVEFLDRIESMFSLTGDRLTIGSALTEFFDSLNTLSLNPASTELRADVIERAQDLVSVIGETYGTIAKLQSEADARLKVEIDVVNGLTAQIAELNQRIASREISGQVAADERDRRALLIDQLSERMSFNQVEASDGSVTLTLPNGFPIVSGSVSRELEVTADPTFAAGPLPPSLNGEVLSYVVYDYDSGVGSAHIDLTQFLQAGSGTIGGLLGLRGYADPTNTSAFEANGTLVELASRVEAITRELLTTFNEIYLGPDADVAPGLQPSALDLDGNPPDVFGLFDFDFAGVKDGDGDGAPSLADLAATGLDNFSSRLQLAFTDPRRLAAARDLTGAGELAPGDASNVFALAGLQDSQLSFSAGSYARTAKISEVFNELVGRVGNVSSRAKVDLSVSQDALIIAQNRRDEIQGVSLDEEFTNLIQFQKAFEANARMIRTSDEMLDIIVGLI
jgi:flagellar hook-associated protein 1